ncbi:15828_t:CDS:2, partial [Funneliformis geosporum]
MSVDLTEPKTPPTQRLGKRKALRIELFTKDLFKERNIYKIMKMQKLIMNFSVLIRHVEVHHPEKDPRPNKKAKKSVTEDQSTLDKFVGQTEIPSKA